MLDPHQLGQEGERLAAEYLAKKGYHILKRNYRYHRHEIDIVAMHQTTLCFIEVKNPFNHRKRRSGRSRDTIEAAGDHQGCTGLPGLFR